MAEVKSIKCPNCGGAVQGTGAVTCPYCGSSLEVTAADKEQLRAVRREFGTAGVDAGVKPPFFFKNLPGVEITRETKEIPFQPTFVYSGLGGEPAGLLRSEADAIVDVVRRTQESINHEDLPSYMTCITKKDQRFRAKAQKGAEAQFIKSDMKRFTVAVDFKKLTAEQASVVVSIEAFIFLNSGQVNHLTVPFGWKLRKEEGRWVVFASGIGGTASGIKWGSCVIPIIGAAIGLVVAIVSVVSECREQTETAAVPEDEVVVWKAESRRKPMPETWFKAKTDLTLYDTPRDESEIEAILPAGGEFQVMSESLGWYHLNTRDHTWGWVPEKELKRQLGKDFALVER
ncbi:MAG: hypothetical protein PVH29_14670 [Candidatus Zixiibacteriota bacterium]